MLDSGTVKSGQVAITYFDTHQENVLWFWSVVVAGGICAVLNPISNEAKTAAGQIENLKALFGDTPVITSHRLSATLASTGLNVTSIQQIGKNETLEKCPSLAIETCSTPSDDSIAAILFTSGSTGHSKAVKFSHAQLLASVRAKSDCLSSRGKTFMSWICMILPRTAVADSY